MRVDARVAYLRALPHTIAIGLRTRAFVDDFKFRLNNEKAPRRWVGGYGRCWGCFRDEKSPGERVKIKRGSREKMVSVGSRRCVSAEGMRLLTPLLIYRWYLYFYYYRVARVYIYIYTCESYQDRRVPLQALCVNNTMKNIDHGMLKLVCLILNFSFSK